MTRSQFTNLTIGTKIEDSKNGGVWKILSTDAKGHLCECIESDNNKYFAEGTKTEFTFDHNDFFKPACKVISMF